MVKTKIFTARIKENLIKELDKEGKEQNRSRNAQLETILEHRYSTVPFMNEIIKRSVLNQKQFKKEADKHDIQHR